VSERGYFGIGIEHGKCEQNLGTLWRSAFAFEAAFIFTIGKRYQRQASDTPSTWRHIPLTHYQDVADFKAAIPYDCRVIGIELHERAKPIVGFSHPERAVYLLGAEDHGLSKAALDVCQGLVVLPGKVCHNVAVAGSLVMFHRHSTRNGVVVNGQEETANSQV
jgi:tRNA G18 (ribose-2'-O)-methylase SpoU